MHSYIRGHGGKISPFVKRTVLSGDGEEIYCPEIKGYRAAHCERCQEHEPRAYKVTFRYEDGTSELIKTVAHSPDEAFDRAQVLRARDERATEVVVKNSIGDIVGRIARGTSKLVKTVVPYAKKAAVKGIKAAYEATKFVGKEGAITLTKYVSEREAKQLLLKAHSSNPAIAVSAKLELREKYPQYYELAFEQPSEPRAVEIITRLQETQPKSKGIRVPINDNPGGKSNPGNLGNPKKLSAQKLLEKEIRETPPSLLPYKMLYKKPGIYVPKEKSKVKPLAYRVTEKGRKPYVTTKKP